jgi:hypothetical protein
MSLLFTNEFIRKNCNQCKFDASDCIKDYYRNSNIPSCRKGLCIKDYYLDGKHEFIKDWYYPIMDENYLGEDRGYGFLMIGNSGFRAWFWESQTEYFDFTNVTRQ